MLSTYALSVAYGDLPVLHDVSVEVRPGEIVSLIGPNGAGKSTLVKAVVGLVQPSRLHGGGQILFQGARIDGLAPEAIARRGIALVPEGARLFPDMSVADNLRMGTVVPRGRAGEQQRRSEVLELFPRLRERMTQPARTLSGGERQMLAFGRALMMSPDLLILDEPSLGLQPSLVGLMMETIRRIRDRGITVFLVEQNVHVSLPMSDRAYVLENGRVLLEGRGIDLLGDPHVQRSYLTV
jgi:branched-chain amino acid transport system ATP-binding protein